MTKSHDPNSFASQLLRQDEALSDSQYQDYRRKLEQALLRAQRRERLAYWISVTSGVIWFGLLLTIMFFRRSIGDLDPWSKNANVWSVAVGLAYVVSVVAFFLSLASYYSRFRPGTREAKERLRDASILELQRQIGQLRQQVADLLSHVHPDRDKPPSGQPPS